jgi:signal peptidase II
VSRSRPVAGLVVGGVVAVDQASKNLVLSRVSVDERIHVLGPVEIVRRFNTGGAFSFAAGKGIFPWIVSLMVIGLVAWFVRAIRRDDPRVRGVSLIALGCMVGGAVSNQLDRLVRSPGWNRGAVVDFVSTGFWGIFNVADAALTCGAVAIAVVSVRRPAKLVSGQA